MALSLVLALSAFNRAFSQIDPQLNISNVGKGLVTGSPVSVPVHSVLKLQFSWEGPGLELCSGTMANYSGNVCGNLLSQESPTGQELLVIIDAYSLNGKYIYVINTGSSSPQWWIRIS
jgi:hypothetical protein